MSAAAILLAAGRSRRFGAADKLTADLDGLPLGRHAARTLAELPFASRIVVTASEALAWPGFEIVRNDDPDAGMARSLALGLAAARRQGADAVLIALADMPFVSAAHFGRLLACDEGPASLAASSDGRHASPPALFGADWFDALAALTGDQGARALLDRARLVVAPPAELIDVDRPEDLRGR